MEEYFDVLNEKGEYIGKTETREKCHKEGLWHKAVVVFIINSKSQVLLQKRSANKSDYAKSDIAHKESPQLPHTDKSIAFLPVSRDKQILCIPDRAVKEYRQTLRCLRNQTGTGISCF